MPSAKSSDFRRYEKALINLGYRGGRSGWNGRLRPDKEAGGSGEGGAAGVRFDQVGSVKLYPGEPCTPQIMFDFHGAGSTVWLGASKYETKILTEAAKSNRRVHISGKWRRGGQSNCSYVEVTSAEVTR
jgi:hypothetical protein